MNFITICLLIGVMIGCDTALAEESGNTPATDASNPFSGPLNIEGAFPKITIAGEDLSSPFTIAHSMEQAMYQSLYYSHYNLIFTPVHTPVLKDMPSAFDAQGRPLWFDGSNGEQSLKRLVSELLSREQIADLDRLLDDWSNPSERLADGRPKLMMFKKALTQEMSSIPDRNKAYEHIRQWREKFPHSRAAALIEAVYWVQYAWTARGSGYSDTVTSEGWDLFGERLRKAEAVLIESEPYAASSALWGNIYLDVGNNLGWPKARLLTFFRDQAGKYKDFDPLYSTTFIYLQPKWGGSWKLVDSLVTEAVKDRYQLDANAMYAQLYWRLAQNQHLQADLSESSADWDKMKRGFEDLMRLYPHSAFNLNNFAAAACVMGDKETFQSLRFQIGKYVTPESWPDNYSPDLCEHKFATQPL